MGLIEVVFQNNIDEMTVIFCRIQQVEYKSNCITICFLDNPRTNHGNNENHLTVTAISSICFTSGINERVLADINAQQAYMEQKTNHEHL